MTSADRTPVIVSAKRTPIGKFMGALSKTKAPQLGAYAIRAALAEAQAATAHVDEVIMGAVLQANLGQNPARQSAIGAGLPTTINCQTINKVCGSGLQSVMLAAQAIKAGDAQVLIAGGMENMSLAPHMVYSRAGIKLGPAEFMDHMVSDGLHCPFENWGMGKAAEWIAAEFKVSREEQDKLAVRSNLLAAESTAKGYFKAEMAALTAEQIGQKAGLDADEGFRPDSSMETLAKLRPAFDKAGTVTAGNASQISDGACALVVMSAAKAEELKLRPLARIVSYHTSGVAPKEIFTAPALSIPAALKKAGMSVGDIDLFEINEAFAAQILHNIKVLGIPLEKLNVAGGGIALGHPIGASGARVLTTLIHQMARLNKKRGVAALCLGGGNAVTMVVER